MTNIDIRDWFRRAWLVLAIAALVIVLDQWTKYLVRQALPIGESIVPFKALGGYVVIHHVTNYGAAFGMLQNLGMLFVGVAVIVTAVILVYLRTLPTDQRLIRVLFGMQIGGAFGNVIDRLHQGYVTDFVKIGIPGVYYWPNFNVADSAIVTGVIGLAALILWQDIRSQRADKRRAGEPDGPVTSTNPSSPAEG
jgi:signal peptidase II